MKELSIGTDDTCLIVGALLSTAINLVRDPAQGRAYDGDPEQFIVLADKVATIFLQEAFRVANTEPSRREAALRDAHEIASIMAAGCEAYETYRPLGIPPSVSSTELLAELKADNKDYN